MTENVGILSCMMKICWHSTLRTEKNLAKILTTLTYAKFYINLVREKNSITPEEVLLWILAVCQSQSIFELY